MATMMDCNSLAQHYINEHPETTLKRNTIKVMLKSGCIPFVTAGNRKFYSYERFTEYLEKGEEVPAPQYGTIRRIT